MSKPLRIMFLSRTTLFSVPGGDTTQVLKTAEALRDLGCEVEVSTELSPDMSRVDLAHLFNITRPQETYLQAIAASKQRIPVVLSPIYVDFTEYDQHARTGLGGRLLKHLSPALGQTAKIAGRMVFNREYNRGTFVVLATGYRRAQKRLIAMASILLPNSQSEMRRMEEDFPSARGKPWAFVPNAIDSNIFDPDKAQPIEELRDCVMCVGRIEGRKCQLELVRALKDTNLRVVLIGKPAPNQVQYFEQIKREMGPTVTLLGEVPHEELARYYASCRVHALVSWMETTGLSSLEAGVMGANLVITDKGDTRDYFGDLAYYCCPDSLLSVREAVLAAYHAPRSNALRERILERYTWRKAAEATLAAYKIVAHKSADSGLIGRAEDVKGPA